MEDVIRELRKFKPFYKYVKGVVIVHPNDRGAVNFDVWGRGELDFEVGYKVEECPYVERFRRIAEELGLKYLFSEDFEHIPEVNRGVQHLINRLIVEGFIVVFSGWGDVDGG